MGSVRMKNDIVQTIQAFQFICLRIIAKALLYTYVTYKLLHYNFLIKITNEKDVTITKCSIENSNEIPNSWSPK